MLTANDTDMDIVDGLEQGADDYITKPFSLSVLRARVNTQLRKRAVASDDNSFRIGNYSFDFINMLFFIGDKNIELSKTEQSFFTFTCRKSWQGYET